MNLEFTSSDEVGSYFEDEFYVDDSDQEIAILQTENFSKPLQNPVFSHLDHKMHFLDYPIFLFDKI